MPKPIINNSSYGDDGGEFGKDDVDDFRHSKMLEMVAGKKSSVKNRSEASSVVSEFYVGRADTSTVDIGDLLSSIKRSVKLATISRNVDEKFSKDKTEVLPSPLSTVESKTVKRQVAFGKVCKEVSKWEKLVLQNRQAEQLVFPLNQIRMKREGLQQLVSKHVSKTPLELEMEALLGKDEDLDVDHTKTKSKSRIAFEEAMELRRNMSRIRARQSYYEEKARRTKKIKSKTYHRILKKDRLKAEVKDFDALSKSNPDLAEEKLMELEKKRILERMSLRHKNTGKWAKYMKIRAHHDKETSRAIQEQLDINQVLTEKKLVVNEDEDDDKPSSFLVDDDAWLRTQPSGVPRGDASNPWMSFGSGGGDRSTAGSSHTADSEVPPEGSLGYRQYWERENARRLAVTKVPSADLDSIVLQPKLAPGDPGAVERQGKSKRRKSDNGTTVAKNGTDRVTAPSKKRKAEAAADVAMKSRKRPAAEQSGKSKSKKSVAAGKKTKNVRFDGGDNESDEVDRIFAAALNVKSKRSTRPAAEKTASKGQLSAGKKGVLRHAEDTEEQRKDADILNETRAGYKSVVPARSARGTPASRNEKEEEEDEKIDIDPNSFITVKTSTVHLNIPDSVDHDPDALDDDDEVEAAEHHRMTLAEAFADDDVVEEFRIKKQAIVDEELPKAVDTTLPGWGCWGGIGAHTSKRKKQKFTIPARKVKKRADRTLGHVIIHSGANTKMQSQKVSKLPYAFNTNNDFEKFINAPIGRDWNPVSAFQRLTTPKVVTKKGAIIEPMNEDALAEDKFKDMTSLKKTKADEIYNSD